MSGSVTQLPWLDIALAADRSDVQSIAYMSAGALASMVAHAGGGAIALDPPDTTYTADQANARASLAIKIIGQKIDRHMLTAALLLVPTIAAAIAAEPSNPPGQLMTVDLLAAWARNWTDYALLVAALG